MEKERAAIVELFLKGKTQSDIMKLLKIPETRRKLIFRTIKLFNETGSLLDRPRSGRPVSVSTVRMRKINFLRVSGIFKSFIISDWVFPFRNNSTIAARSFSIGKNLIFLN